MESGNVYATQAMTPADQQQEERLKRRDKELSQQWLAARGALDELQRQAQPDPGRRQKLEKQAQEIQKQQQQCERDWRAFHETLYLRNPRLAQQRSARTATLEEAATCLPADTALLEYSVLNAERKGEKEELALFVVTRKGDKPRLNVYRLKADVSALARKAQAFRQACAGRPDTPAERPYKDLARQLYRLLLAPAETALTGKHRLILCPDGPLWNLPFQALLRTPPAAAARRSGKQQPSAAFLWERYQIVYAVSATGMKAALDARQRPKRPKAQKTLLVMANPDFGTEERLPGAASRTAQLAPQDTTPRALFSRGGGLRALPFTSVEAKAIAALFPHATLKTGEAAQESLLKQAGGEYRYLHFATHALCNDAAPLLSGIVLARPPASSPDDGILTVRELFGLHLSAEMLVLSACETARGTQRQGEGVIGLSWAAFVAGVGTQVVSQWSVDDAATAQLMAGFYGGVKQGQAKDAALRGAALSLLRDGRHSHPFYWAPFLVLGDWR
jgi:CHAT domain-containing protein